MFCVEYYPHKLKILEADEFKIKYNPEDRTLKDFLEKFKDKTIIIDINSNTFSETDIKLFSALAEEHTNFKVIFNFYNKKIRNLIINNNIPFFFSNFVSTIDEARGMMEYSPTDMYICEELCFSLDRVSKLLHDNNIKVRVFPNICQSSYPKTPSIKKFFIRPDDIPIYEDYVDVFELISDEQRVEIIYKIYKQHKWIGKLSEIIPTFKEDVNNGNILDVFGGSRIKCKKRCMYGESCNICDLCAAFSNTLGLKNMVIRRVTS